MLAAVKGGPRSRWPEPKAAAPHGFTAHPSPAACAGASGNHNDELLGDRAPPASPRPDQAALHSR